MITLTFHTDTWRVRITGTNLAAGVVRVERSINGLWWETVRGGSALEVDGGGGITLDDWEYAPGVENHYRIVAAVDETFDVPAADQQFGDPYEVPAGVRSLLAECWGAGGSVPDLSGTRTGGAGGGAYAAADLAVIPGETLLVRAGAAHGSGVNGNSSAVIRGTTILVQAAGGEGVSSLTPSAGAAGGSGSFPDSVGDVTNAGGDGGDQGTTSGGGGGGSGTAAGAGANGANGSGSTGGAGGAGEGDGGDGGGNTEAGNPGGLPGGGAGGHGSGGEGLVLGGPGRVRLHSWPMGTPEQDSIVVTGHDKIILKSVRYPMLNRPVTVSDFSDITRTARAALFPVKGSPLPVEVRDVRSSHEFTVELLTETGEAERTLDLILAVGEPMLLHTPPDCVVPGGYVAIGDISDQRRTRSARSPRRYWSLPCTVVDAPGPHVIPTTLTWGTVLRAYGSWTALLAAHPDWADLLSTVGSPEDPVVF